MDIDTSPNKWTDQNRPDPRFPTNPEFVELDALAAEYSLKPSQILELALVRPGTCLRSDGNPWVDHGDGDQSLYFHEPTLRAARAAKAL